MPLLFSYGDLQREPVQRSTFGRRLEGESDELVGFELSSVPIDDPEAAARLGKTHHVNARINGNDKSRVPGMVFEVTQAELASADEFERVFAYERVATVLASGREAWVYINESEGRHR
ncbi:MAG TPA: gamma-glutamylcyclotransferase family protein [Steroidobacteraceae bacterium]|nr:gamma-glutamylcyclotransferase family protein [Steroidobacteraceae bacterium]